MLRGVRAVQRQVVGTGPVVGRRAARLAEAPLPVGLSASTLAAYGDGGRRCPAGIVTVAGGADERVAERVGDADPVGLARARRRGRVDEAERRSVPPRRVGLEGLEHGRGRGRRAAQHLDLQPRVVAVPRRCPADAHGARTQRRQRRRELGEVLDRVDRRRDRPLGEPDEALLVRCRSRAGTRRPSTV